MVTHGCLFRVHLLITVVVLIASAAAADQVPSCSLNGDLIGGECRCDAAWEGHECERLRLLAANPNAGLQCRGELGIFSSWGGSVQVDSNGTFHMFASVIENGCGLNAWRPNSAIGHATSSFPAGPYTLKRIIKPHFAHSPEVVRGADGAWLVYHVGAGDNNTDPCPDPSAQTCEFTRNCSSGCTGPAHPWLSGLGFYGPSAVLRANSPWGPWTAADIGTCQEVPDCEPNATYPGNGNDMNPAPFVFENDSVFLLWRSINYTKGSGQSYYAAARAPSWNGPFAWSTANLFPDFSWCHIEDGFLYKNSRGWHAIFHSDCEAGSTSGGAAGGHGFSPDGKHWFFHPKNAYNNTIQLEDGTTWFLNRRERPKLIIDAAGRITHLINGVSRPGKANGCYHSDHPFRGGGDHTFTFVQPVATRRTDEIPEVLL